MGCPECVPPRTVFSWICARCLETAPLPEDRCGCIPASPFPVRSLLWLDERSAGWLRGIKFGKRPEWLSLYRPALKSGFRRFFPPGTAIVPVPLPRERLWDRGFNQSEWLAREIAALVGESLADGLERSSGSSPQHLLSRRERLRHVARAFRWSREVPVPSRALLVDDVCTSGATLLSCATALRRAGCEEVFGWTLFRTPGPNGF